MNYTDLHTELKRLFIPGKPEIDLGSGMKICNISFTSEIPREFFSNPEDPAIRENTSFSYPVFCPAGKSNKAILMLHGLNERSWEKYLTWAYHLALRTSSYVILFPISFHMNRSPESWSNPRSMLGYLNLRNSAIGKISQSSFVNVALSNRLTDDPMRFFYSGFQTAGDIVSLLESVKSGCHPVIPEGCRINIFAYSIGGFLSQIMMMGNPGNLLSESKLFIFCGGSVFSKMNGSSKLIMDSRAFDRVYSYFLNDFEGTLKEKNRLSEFLQTSRIGMAFRSMIDTGRHIEFRENLFSKLRDQVYVLALKDDAVIPASGIVETLEPARKKSMIRILDFGYKYSHENPFPVICNNIKDEVNRCFDTVFSSAAAFL
jgi:hypothetical protein